jgi:hypothetical protein
VVQQAKGRRKTSEVMRRKDGRRDVVLLTLLSISQDLHQKQLCFRRRYLQFRRETSPEFEFSQYQSHTVGWMSALWEGWKDERQRI